MANKMYDESAIRNIAIAIRSADGTENTYSVSEMSGAIMNLSGGATLTVTETDDGVKITATDKNGTTEAELIVPGVVQITGDSETKVMSQKATTRELATLSEQVHDGLTYSYYLTLGTFSVSDGSEMDSTKRVRSGFIRMKKGDRIHFSGDSNTYGGVSVFAYDQDLNYVKRVGNGVTDYTATEDYYVRMLMKYVDDREITDPSEFYKFVELVGSVDASTIYNKLDAISEQVHDGLTYSYYLTLGTFGVYDGSEIDSTKRVRSGFIRMKKGDRIHFSGDLNTYGGVSVFAYDQDLNYVKRVVDGVTDYTATEDYYVRILMKYVDDREITDPSEFYKFVELQESTESQEKKYHITGDFTSYYTAPDCEALGAELTNSTVEYIYNRYDTLMSDHPTYIQKRVLGYATNADGTQNQVLPLYEYEIKVDNPATDRVVDDVPTIIMMSGVHGNEKSSVYAMLQFFEELFGSDHDVLLNIRSNFNFKVIPIVNPYGYNNNQRANARNIDLNRNFGYIGDGGYREGESVYSEQETQVVRDWLLENKDALIFIDNHNMPDATTWYPCVSYLSTYNDALQKLYCSLIRRMSIKWCKKYFTERTGTVLGYYEENNNPISTNEAYHIAGISNACTLEIKNCDENGNFYTKAVLETGLEQLVNFVASFIDSIK